jgi:hypothetical protein
MSMITNIEGGTQLGYVWQIYHRIFTLENYVQ